MHRHHCFQFLRKHVFGAGLSAIIIIVATSCGKASPAFDGEYRVGFQWENGALRSTSISRSDRPGEIPKSDRNQVAKLSEPFIRDSVHSANVDRAAGTLRLVVLGHAPYFTEVRELRITQPDFEDLYAATQLQDLGKIRKLVAEYHNVNQRELPSLQTALAIAAAGGYLQSLRTLLDLGADPNIPNYIGVTPLMAAVTAGSEDAVRMLLAAGSNVAAVNSAGDSAVSLAKKLHHENLLPLLIHSETST